MNTMIKQCLFVLLAIGVLQGCSRPGHSEVEVDPEPFFYSFVAEDASLVGLLVSDSTGTVATEISPGVYQFGPDYLPTTPITFESKNLVEPGASFQDIDEDGLKSATDINYNVGLEIAYIGSFSALGERTVFANPITALIPSTGIPSSGIGGLPEELFQLAFLAGIAGAPTTTIELSDGIELSIKAVLSRTAVLLTALQEGIVILEGDTQAAVDVSIAVLASFRDAEPTEGLADITQLSIAMQSAIESHVSQANSDKVMQLASSIGNTLASTTDATFYEALILAVQQNVNASSTVASILEKLTVQEFSRLDNSIQFAVKLANEIAESGGMSAFLNSLSIVPINVSGNGQSIVDDGVTDFNLELITSTETIKLNGSDAFFDQSELTYYFEDDLYGVKVDADHAVLIALNANETNLLGAAQNGINSARLLALCWNSVEQPNSSDSDVCGSENANLEYYALATQSEVCAADFDAAELAQINALNRQQISCN
ncbi:hypothetical protein KO525_15410 [Psychrosphaera sp. B3R10]|uniref:hypothetical protein n=1 Tax=unclassified Psychrosphaera TaxID=2641570 RepID=UPI001C09FEE8|nr:MULTISPECIES: hypothetical protein [unclassified Psychrosphaera]MBU2881003.1 hypothetical protein [Psychrosphaera sp. I2R16]MBU2990778.1 hypothetical protein [Psychrosphaera sp. B3R10]